VFAGQVIRVVNERAGFDWIGLVVAIGTLVLAVVTYLMVRKAGSQLALEQRRVEASQRPVVYPSVPVEWIDASGPYAGRRNEVLPLKNSGPGIAFNVAGKLYFSDESGVHVDTVEMSLGPGDVADVRFNWRGEARGGSWHAARGYLVYEDVADVRWRTEYEIREEGPDNSRRRFVRVGRIGKDDELGAFARPS
jgi:hypothetical protein